MNWQSQNSVRHEMVCTSQANEARRRRIVDRARCAGSRGPWGVRLALLLLGLVPASAFAVPTPPCGHGSGPAYPLPRMPPITETSRGELATGWEPPTCLGWNGREFSLLVTLSGSFHYTGSAADLLA